MTKDRDHDADRSHSTDCGCTPAFFVEMIEKAGMELSRRDFVKGMAAAGGVLAVEDQTAPQLDPPDLWLLFAPIKKARTDFIVEKAAELGVARILPVQSDFTNSERIRLDHLLVETGAFASRSRARDAILRGFIGVVPTIAPDPPCARRQEPRGCRSSLVGPSAAAVGPPPAGPWAARVLDGTRPPQP